MNNNKRYAPFKWQPIDVGKVDSSNLVGVLESWNRKKDDRATPTWDSTEIENLPAEIVPYATVIDVGDGKPPFPYRFFGSGLARMHTFELTNKTTNEIEPDGFRNLCVDQHLTVIESRRPMAFLNDIPTQTEGLFRTHVILRLPYCDVRDRVTNVFTIEESERQPGEARERIGNEYAGRL